jgi:hypothetical protein
MTEGASALQLEGETQTGLERIEIWTDGKTSNRVKDELTKRPLLTGTFL